jgi:hypothetical protein
VVENVGNAVARDVKLTYRHAYIPDPSIQQKLKTMPMSEPEHMEIMNIAPRSKLSDTLLFTLSEDVANSKAWTTWPTLVMLFLDLSYLDEASGENYETHTGFTGLITGTTITQPEMFQGTIPPPDAMEKATGKKTHRMTH